MSFYGYICISVCQLMRIYALKVSYIGGRHIGRRLDPLDSVADLLNGINEGTDVSRDIIEQVNGWHF
jgi:hypothetical protein